VLLVLHSATAAPMGSFNQHRCANRFRSWATPSVAPDGLFSMSMARKPKRPRDRLTGLTDHRHVSLAKSQNRVGYISI